jgi:hypothetical protein
MLVILGFDTAGLFFIVSKLRRQFAWDIYRHLQSSSVPLRRSYLCYEVCDHQSWSMDGST